MQLKQLNRLKGGKKAFVCNFCVHKCPCPPIAIRSVVTWLLHHIWNVDIIVLFLLWQVIYMLINYSFPCKDIGKQDKTARSLTGASDAGAYNYVFNQALIAVYHIHFPNNARNLVNLFSQPLE